MTNIEDKIELLKARNYEYLTRIRNLPSIPSVMIEVSSILDDPRTSATELGKVISKDQALVAKLLTVANSPLYGLPRKVSTIEFAIVILGFEHIKNIVIALSMMEAFKNRNAGRWNRQKFWSHSLAVAALSKRIASDLGYVKTGEAFTAGLLHDLGISVIQRYFNKGYNEICDKVEVEGLRYFNAEGQILGLTHNEIGQFLINNWNLPDNLGQAILYHHQPSLAEGNKILPAIIHLADYTTQVFQKGDFDWDENMELDLNVIDILSLSDRKYLDSFIDTYRDSYLQHIENLETK